MAKYTIELRNLLQTSFKLPLDSYPIWDEAYRSTLNRKIVDHYYFREIGLETPDMFAHFLKRKMDEIMPYYNDLMLSKSHLAKNPLHNRLFTETLERTQKDDADTVSSSLATAANTISTTDSQDGTTHTEGTSDVDVTAHGEVDETGKNTTVEGQQDSRRLKSDTPQGNISIADVEIGGHVSEIELDRKEQVTNTTDTLAGSVTDSTTGTVGSTTADSTSHNTSTGTANSRGEDTRSGRTDYNLTSTEDYIKAYSGFEGWGYSQSVELERFRKTILNIDRMIIDDLAELFMGVY